MAGEEDERIPPPTSKWWKQRSLLLGEAVGIALLAGGVIAAVASWSEFWRGLTAGALLGTGAGIVIGELFNAYGLWEQHQRFYVIWQKIDRREHREALLSRTETDNAYYLGHAATTLPMVVDSVPDQVALIRRFCSDLGLRFSLEEQELLESMPIDRSGAEKISKIVFAKAQELGPPLWCFFQLGNTTAWLSGQLDSWRDTRAVVGRLEDLQGNPFLQLDPRYTNVVNELVKVIGPHRDLDGTEAQGALKDVVLSVLSGIPAIYIPSGSLSVPVPSSEWVWVEDSGTMIPARIVGDNSILARSPDLYEVSQHSDESAEPARVTHSETGWKCSLHAEANENQPCSEIDLVLFATDGGQPVTEARFVAVREVGEETES